MAPELSAPSVKVTYIFASFAASPFVVGLKASPVAPAMAKLAGVTEPSATGSSKVMSRASMDPLPFRSAVSAERMTGGALSMLGSDAVLPMRLPFASASVPRVNVTDGVVAVVSTPSVKVM